jgi:hypothetical protein
MGRNIVGAVAIVLCTLLVGAMIFREKCRLGNVRWQACSWAGMPHVGGPYQVP